MRKSLGYSGSNSMKIINHLDGGGLYAGSGDGLYAGGSSGRGTRIEDQSVSLNDLKDFYHRMSGRGTRIEDQSVSLNDLKDFFGKIKGRGTRIEDQQVSLNDLKDFYHRMGGKGLNEPLSRTSGEPAPLMGYGTTINHHHYHMNGGNLGDEIRNAFDPHKNGLSKSLENTGQVLKQTFTKTLPSALIHQGIPAVSGLIGSIAAEAIAPEGGPVSGLIGNTIGKKLGKMGADKLGQLTGYGFQKGSKEAKEWGANMVLAHKLRKEHQSKKPNYISESDTESESDSDKKQPSLVDYTFKKRQGRFKKGSIEAKEWGKRMAQLRKK